jgi:ferredoxin
VKIVLDEARCVGRGICHYEAPDVYGLDDRGFCVVLTSEVGEHQVESAELGAVACPEQALSVE